MPFLQCSFGESLHQDRQDKAMKAIVFMAPALPASLLGLRCLLRVHIASGYPPKLSKIADVTDQQHWANAQEWYRVLPSLLVLRDYRSQQALLKRSMIKRVFGSTGLAVSALGLGCNNFGMRLDLDQNRAVVDAATQVGINFIGTDSRSYMFSAVEASSPARLLF
jgi:hypothetical protein